MRIFKWTIYSHTSTIFFSSLISVPVTLFNTQIRKTSLSYIWSAMFVFPSVCPSIQNKFIRLLHHYKSKQILTSSLHTSGNKVVKSSEETCEVTPQKSDWQTENRIFMSIYVYVQVSAQKHVFFNTFISRVSSILTRVRWCVSTTENLVLYRVWDFNSYCTF